MGDAPHLPGLPPQVAGHGEPGELISTVYLPLSPLPALVAPLIPKLFKIPHAFLRFSPESPPKSTA